MMARNNDVMVGDRILQEIGGVLRGKAEKHLGPAEVVLILIPKKRSLGEEISVECPGYLEYGDRSFREMSVEPDSDSGLEMSVVSERVHKVRRDCAMGEKDFSGGDVDMGWICLEAGFSGKGLRNHHRNKGGDIAFAA